MKCYYCNENHSEGYLIEAEQEDTYRFICSECLADYVEDNLDDFIYYFENAFVTMGEDDLELVDQLFIGEEFECESFYEWCYDNKQKVIEAVAEHYCTEITTV